MVGAIIVTIVIMAAALLMIVYNRVYKTLLVKSENLLQETTDKTLQQTNAWMNKTLTMLQMQRDTIEYENMEIPEMMEYIRPDRWPKTPVMWLKARRKQARSPGT